MFRNQFEEPVDQLLTLEVADLAKRDVAAQMFVAVCITAKVLQRTARNPTDSVTRRR